MLLLIPLLPFLGFLVNATIGRRWPKSLSGGLATLAMALSFGVAATSVWQLWQLEPVNGVRAIDQVVFTWLLWDSYRVVPQQFQKLPAGLVWLALIPCLGLIVWIAAMIMVPMSFRDAFAARGRSDFGDCGAKFGYGYLAGAVLGLIPFIGPLFSIGALICWIMFMVKCRQMKSAILAG